MPAPKQVVYKQRAPNGLTYRVSGPPGATTAQVQAKILEQFPEAGKQRVAPPRTRGSGIGAVDTALDNINEIIMGVPSGAYNLAAMVTDPISGMIFGKDAVKQAQAQRRAFGDTVSRNLVTTPRPLARSLGESIAPGAAVTRTAKVLAPLAPKIPVIGDVVSKVLTSTASGGVGVRGASIPETVALKVAGGSASGASTAALMGEDPVEGALYGAGIPVLGTVFKKLVGGGVDIFRMTKVKAGKILREALGKDVEAAKAAFASLAPDDQRLAQQVLIDAGIEPSRFFGVGKIVADQIDPDATKRILNAQEAARNARLADISGGADETARRAAANVERRAVNEATGPAREAALSRAPILAAPLVNTLRQQAEAKGVRTSSARRALLKLASQIEGATDQNGMLDPYDLYTLRKEASDIVEKYVASSAQPSTGSKKRAAGLVIGFKNAVDEALGPDFKEYLVQHQRGMQNVNTQELTARGAQLAKESPDEFIALMRGERPKIVEDVYGKGANQFDIAGMALADPRRYNAMMMSAKELETLNKMTDLQSLGETAGGKLLTKEQPGFLSRIIRAGVGLKFPSVAFAGQQLNQTQKAFMSPRVQKELADAYRSGPNMMAALNEIPTAARISEQVQRLNPTARNVMAQQFALPSSLGSQYGFPDFDPETGEPLIDIDSSEGYPVPIYGRVSRNSMRR